MLARCAWRFAHVDRRRARNGPIAGTLALGAPSAGAKFQEHPRSNSCESRASPSRSLHLFCSPPARGSYLRKAAAVAVVVEQAAAERAEPAAGRAAPRAV